MPNLFSYASQTRKDGESWPDAVKRAEKELFGSSDDSKKPKNRKKKKSSNDFSGPGRNKRETPAQYKKRRQTSKS